MFNLRLSLIQVIFRIAIILLMAHFAVRDEFLNISRNIYHERRTGIITFILITSIPRILVLDYIHVLLGFYGLGLMFFI
jgi:hypothetical protein